MYKGLMEYLESCPLLSGQKFNFDCVTEDTGYSISIPANEPEITKDALGNSECQLIFYLNSVNDFGEDATNNIKNLDFFQDLKKWFKSQNQKKIFPVLGGSKVVKGVHATTDGYIEATKSSIGRYQIQCKVLYTQANTWSGKAPLRF